MFTEKNDKVLINFFGCRSKDKYLFLDVVFHVKKKYMRQKNVKACITAPNKSFITSFDLGSRIFKMVQTST